MQEPEQRRTASHRADPPGATSHRATPGNDTDGLTVVTPVGKPGQVAPRLTGPRATHSRAARPTRVGSREWLAITAAAALVLTMFAAAGAFRGSGPRSELADATQSTDFSNPDAGTLPPDVGTVPPVVGDVGVPGDGSPPPTAPASSDPAATAAPAPVPPPAPKTYTAVTGEGCEQKADHGFFRKGFAKDWRLPGKGGWTNDGCRGNVVSVPMSGDARKDDADNVIVWWFVTGAVRRGTCAISPYVPDTGNPSDSAGQPAHYKVYGTSDATGPAIAEFNVDQTRNRGRFVDGDKVTLPGSGRLSVRMVTRGVDFGSGRDGAHLGVSALRVTCAAA